MPSSDRPISVVVLLVLAGLSVWAGCRPSAAPPVAPESATENAVPDATTQNLSLDDFRVFPDSDDSWSQQGDGVIACAGATKGYIYTDATFDVGVISFEYQFPDDLADDVIPNTGLLVLIEPPHKKWPRCIEAQGKQPEAGQLKGNGGVTDLNVEMDEVALAEAIKPPGQWNAVDVTITSETVTAIWNGQQTATCQRRDLPAGPFGLQSEGNAVLFRNIQFRPANGD